MRFIDSCSFIAGCIFLWILLSIYSQIKLMYICITCKITIKEYNTAYRKNKKVTKFSIDTKWSYQVLTLLLKLIGVCFIIIYIILRYRNS